MMSLESERSAERLADLDMSSDGLPIRQVVVDNSSPSVMHYI